MYYIDLNTNSVFKSTGGTKKSIFTYRKITFESRFTIP